MWDLIVSVPDHCLSFYLGNLGFSEGLTSFGRVQPNLLESGPGFHIPYH